MGTVENQCFVLKTFYRRLHPKSAPVQRWIFQKILESYATDASQDEHEAVFHVEPLSPPRLVSSTCDGERITEAEKDELAQQKLRTRKVKRVRSREVEKAERTKQKLETRKVKHVAMPEHNPLSKSALQEEMEQDAEMVKAGYPTMVEESPCLDSSMFAEIKQENTDEGCIEIKEEPIDFKTEGLRDGLKLPAETMEEARLHTFKEESPSLDSSMATENKQECTDEGCIEIKEEPIDFKTEVLHDGLWSDKQPSEIPETKKSRTDFAGLGCEARGDIVKSLEDKKMNIYVDKDWIKSECAVNMNC